MAMLFGFGGYESSSLSFSAYDVRSKDRDRNLLRKGLVLDMGLVIHLVTSRVRSHKVEYRHILARVRGNWSYKARILFLFTL